MTSLAKIGAGIGSAALAGFGVAAGRSAWRKTSKNGGTILILLIAISVIVAAVALPFWGGREMTKGHQRKPLTAFVLTILSPICAVILGFFAGCLVDPFLQDTQGMETAKISLRYPLIISFTGAAFAAGMLAGLIERRKRLIGFAVVRANDEFLSKVGIREVSDPNATHVDIDGNLLRFMDRSPDRLTFFAVGRRNRRAYISISALGRMTAYSGVLPISQTWLAPVEPKPTPTLEEEHKWSLGAEGDLDLDLDLDLEVIGRDVEKSQQLTGLGSTGASDNSAEAFLASLAPAPTRKVETLAKEYSAPRKPLNAFFFWPLTVIAAAIGGFFGLLTWLMGIAPLMQSPAIESHPLSLLTIFVPAIMIVVLLRNRRQLLISQVSQQKLSNRRTASEQIVSV